MSFEEDSNKPDKSHLIIYLITDEELEECNAHSYEWFI